MPRRISKNEPIAGRWTRTSSAGADALERGFLRSDVGADISAPMPPEPQEVTAIDAGSWSFHAKPRRNVGRGRVDHGHER